MIFNFIFIFFITIIIAYLFGIVLVNLIDNRLSKINLTIPQTEKFENENKNKEIIIVSTEKKIPEKSNFNNNRYKQMTKDAKVEGFSNQPDSSYKEWYIEKKNTQTCIKDHIHDKKGRDINCNYGITNYADPMDMSSIDYKIFNLNYPSNMTLQDYINWLYCYKDKEDQLPYNHLKNLEKIKSGKELHEEHGVLPPPGYYYPAMNSEDYFDKMYNDVNEFNIAGPLNSVTGPMVGYNYDEYSEFSQNLDMNGTSGKIRNTDIALKKDAKKLFNYINPKDSNSINIEKKNQIYHMKNVEV